MSLVRPTLGALAACLLLSGCGQEADDAAMTAADHSDPLMSAALADQITAINTINAYAVNNTATVPVLNDYLKAGFLQVTASNLTEINTPKKRGPKPKAKDV